MRISELPEDHKSVANTILANVFCAIRPLSVKELRHALAVTTSESEVFEEDWLMDQDQITSLCVGLVVIGEDASVRFSHFTVKEYLKDAHIDGSPVFASASKDLALTCLHYLTLNDFIDAPDTEGMKRRIDEMAFLRYSAQFWHRHDYKPANDDLKDIKLRDYLERLFLAEDQAFYYNWLRVYNPDPRSSWLGECPWLQKDALPLPTLLTGFFGLHELNSKMMEDTQDQMKYLRAELNGHLRANHLTEVKALLDRGVSPDFRDDDDEPILMACESLEATTIVLDHGAEPNATSARGWNALQRYARDGMFDQLKLIHSRGANIPPATGHESALHHAVYMGHYEIVKYLLENGAVRDIKEEGEVGPLPHWAAAHGQYQILQLLVEYGADLEAICSETKATVLEWLMGEGYRYAVQGKPSGWGMGTQHEQVALYLLDSQISVDQIRTARNSSGETILHWAAQRGYESVVKAGIEKGVDVMVRCYGDSYTPTALEIAQSMPNPCVITLLEEAEPQINQQGIEDDYEII